jgi:hypothetical protein
MTTTAPLLKIKNTTARNACINVVNFIRVKILEKPELDTPEKRFRDAMERTKGITSFDKIMKNVKTCENKLQYDTVDLMIAQFKKQHGRLCNDKYVELKEALMMRSEELCMYF